jgi:hypothetical protein
LLVPPVFVRNQRIDLGVVHLGERGQGLIVWAAAAAIAFRRLYATLNRLQFRFAVRLSVLRLWLRRRESVPLGGVVDNRCRILARLDGLVGDAE